MILSYKWLKELTGTTLTPEKLAEQLTKAGLNVEEVQPVVDGDFALDADITTNRPDWLCHLGVAHEIAAIEKTSVKRPDTSITESGPDVNTLTSVTVMPGAEEACPRYTARVIRNVKVGPSPKWLQDRLVAIGQRPINNVVDITNLVCFEMNQPLHAFDMDKLAEKRIVLRMAADGEGFAAITGESGKLDSSMLVIADAEKAVALAGVKGGTNTEVGNTTLNVFLESAWFQPRNVRKAARKTKMSSESSYRYERGIDPGMTEEASRRAARLILELAGGELAAGVIDTNPDLANPVEVSLRFARCEKILGFRVEPDEISEIFSGLGLKETFRDNEKITILAPTFRRDVKCEADLIEEVVRLAGYDRIPDRVTMPLELAHELREVKAARHTRRVLMGLGCHECSTDSFVPADWCGGFDSAAAYEVCNPINAERPLLRTSLIPSLLEVRRTNRLEENVALFEMAKIYHKTANGPVEPYRLGIVDDRGEDYVRGAVECVCRAIGVKGVITVETTDAYPGFMSGSGGILKLDGKQLAKFGLISNAEVKRFDLDSTTAVAEIDVTVMAVAEKRERFYQPLPRFPGIRRDISLSLPETVKWVEVEAIVRKTAKMLDSLSFESIYRGKGLKQGFKALAFSMVLRSPERSLTDAEANAVRDDVSAALLAAFTGSDMR